jgi:rare lipoprotein A (peptidoglycan hydrolase)
LSPRIRTTRIVTAVLSALGATAVVTSLVIGLSGLPAAEAVAEPAPYPTTFGVVGATAVTVAIAAEPKTKFGSKSSSSAGNSVSPKSKMLTRKPGAPKPKPKPKPKAKRPSYGAWHSARVSWYGPGFYGNTMAGGGQLRPTSMVVAHRTLPFGTRIQFSYRGRTVIAVVRDRGPYISGRTFDLGPGTAKKLRFSGVGTVRYRLVKK